MKIFILYDISKKEEIELIDNNSISEIAKECFSKEITSIQKVSCQNLHTENRCLDYYCVIDEKIENDPLGKKRNFEVQFRKLLSSQLNGLIKIETEFQLDSIRVPNRETVDKTSEKSESDAEFDYEKRAEMYKPQEPLYTFDRVILPESVIEKIEESLSIIEYENKVFKEWGLYTIQPNPSSALSFYGPSGTGKTMAAEAIASKLNRKILKVSYADIESKFHGEGPKMVKAIFLAAQRENAVLFIDEADSLLSKRLTNVTQGSEQAINSMRSQLLICLEEFKGIVIFATNLVVNYDQAFLTRLISIEFIKPDISSRKKIWDVHIQGNGIHIPLAENVDTLELAQSFDFCGRQIRKSVISACVSVAMKQKQVVSQEDFIRASEKIQEEKERLVKAEDHTKTKEKSTF